MITYSKPIAPKNLKELVLLFLIICVSIFLTNSKTEKIEITLGFIMFVLLITSFATAVLIIKNESYTFDDVGITIKYDFTKKQKQILYSDINRITYLSTNTSNMFSVYHNQGRKDIYLYKEDIKEFTEVLKFLETKCSSNKIKNAGII